MKRFKNYLLWTFTIILILYVGSEIQSYFKEYANQYYKPTLYIVFTTLFPIMMGLIIRIPKLITDILQKEKWSVNWTKLITVGFPALFIALSPLFQLSEINILFLGFSVTTIAGVISGYVILDSLYEK